jgi:hypothetical protein
MGRWTTRSDQRALPDLNHNGFFLAHLTGKTFLGRAGARAGRCDTCETPAHLCLCCGPVLASTAEMAFAVPSPVHYSSDSMELTQYLGIDHS